MRFHSISLLFLVTTLISCNHSKFPEFVTQKVAAENVKLNDVFFETDLPERDSNPATKKYDFSLDSLMLLIEKFEKNPAGFSLDYYKENWDSARERILEVDLGAETAKKWFKATGFLFELTGETKYSEELERIVYSDFKRNLAENEIQEHVQPYIFTKYVDHIHINLFISTEIIYNHSMGGDVRIWQKTDFPESGTVRVNFSINEKKYIELFIRIPSWAEDAAVEVKGVKYLAMPGSYCKIAKKWKEGDVVKIEFPINRIPDYLR